MDEKEMIEKFRAKLLHAMLHGSQIVINLDTYCAAFNNMDSHNTLPLKDMFFNREQLFDNDSFYKDFLR